MLFGRQPLGMSWTASCAGIQQNSDTLDQLFALLCRTDVRCLGFDRLETWLDVQNSEGKAVSVGAHDSGSSVV